MAHPLQRIYLKEAISMGAKYSYKNVHHVLLIRVRIQCPRLGAWRPRDVFYYLGCCQELVGPHARELAGLGLGYLYVYLI